MTSLPPNPYAQPPFVPAVRRPPLPRAMARSARVAGGVGFVLLSVGWAIFSVAAAIGLLWALLSAVFVSMAASDREFAADWAAASRWLATLPLGLIIGALVAGAVIGAGIWVAGLFTSSGILRRAGHPRPWAVTWAGLGLGIVASWIATGIAQVVGQLAGFAVTLPARQSSRPQIGALIGGVVVQGVIWLIVLAVLHVVAGVLLWWWMAYAMRPAAPTAGRIATV